MENNKYKELVQLGFLDNTIIPLIEELKKFEVDDIKGKTADETHYKVGELEGRMFILNRIIGEIKRRANEEKK